MSDRIKLFLPLILFLSLAFVFLVLQGRQATGDYDPSALPSALIGRTLPEFELATLESETLIGVDDLPGGPYLLNVWATWCVACKAEHPYLNRLADGGITILGLNYKDDRQDAIRWLNRLGDPYQLNIFDAEGSLGLNLGVYGAPETYVIDETGVVRYRQVGVLNERVWRKHIQPLGINW